MWARYHNVNPAVRKLEFQLVTVTIDLESSYVLEEAKPRRTDRRPVGRHKRPRKWPRYLLFLTVTGLLVAGGVEIRRLRPTRDLARHQLITVGHAAVREMIDVNLRSAFADDEETMVEPLSENKYRIAGWVDLITEGGRSVRRTFSCVIYRNSSGNWVGENVSVIPQM